MADHRLDLAEALLAKARSTSFQGERESFVAGAYSQLGAFLEEGPRRSQTRRRPVRVLGRRPAGALPAAPAERERGRAGDPEPAVIVDLAAAERAYRAHDAGRAPSGVFVDLAI